MGKSKSKKPKLIKEEMGLFMMHCPRCQRCVRVNISYTPTTRAHLMTLIMFCGIFWCCSCLPYLYDIYENAECYCAECELFLGQYKNDCTY